MYGHGRLLSAQKLGWEKLRCDIKEGLSESQKLLMTLAENEERENAGPLFTAGLYQKLMAAEKLQTPGELADKIGKERTTVGKYLSLAKVPEEVQKSGNRFPLGLCHWLEIAKLPEPYPFQVSRKGKGWAIGSEAISMEDLDFYVQRFRCAVIDYLSAEEGRMKQKAA